MKSALRFMVYFVAINAVISESINDAKKRFLALPNLTDNPFNQFNPLLLEIGIMLRKIHDFDFHQSTITIDGFFYTSWSDKRLKWNVTEKAPLRWFGFPKNKSWKPQSRIFNRAKREESVEGNLLLILPNGQIHSSKYSRIHTVCIPSARYFPFDVHQCQILAGFPMAEGKSTNISFKTREDKDIWNYYHKGNPRWNLISFDMTPMYIRLLDGTYPCVSILLKFNRTVPQLALIIMCPILLCALLGLLPPDSGAKYRLLLSIAALVVVNKIIDFLYEVLPLTTEETPIIVNYALTCLVFLWVSTAHTFVVLTIIRWSSSPPSFLTLLVSSRASQWLLHYSLIGNFSENNKVNLVDEMQNNEDGHSVNDAHIEWSKVAVLLDVLGFNAMLIYFILLSISVSVTE